MKSINSPMLSVIIMAFNEASTVEKVVREFYGVLQTLEEGFEILIIDDGSIDGTSIIADRLAEELTQIRVLHHPNNQGLGAVYRAGFLEAQGEFVTFFPADGQFPATIIQKFFPFTDTADMILGYLPDRSCSLWAKGLSRIERLLYRMLFGKLPKIQGVLMFRKSLLQEITLTSPAGRGWAVVMELIIRASRQGYTIISVPTEVHPRLSGKSKVRNFSTIWENLIQMIALQRHL